MAGTARVPWLVENGNIKTSTREVRHHSPNADNVSTSTREVRHHSPNADNVSTSSLRKKFDLTLIPKIPYGFVRRILENLQQVILGTKLSVLFPAIPLAIAAHYYGFGRPWVFALSMLGLTPLAERISFLTEQIAFYTGPAVGGLLNATCGNATKLIIALFALYQHKIDVVKYSLLGSILSNLLLVLGTSLFCGSLANLRADQKYDRKQADVNTLLLVLALLFHILPLMFKYADDTAGYTAQASLSLSRVSCIIMLTAYVAYLVFLLWTQREFFEAQEEEGDDDLIEETPMIGFWSGFAWLVGMTLVTALLSEYVVGTIEDASSSWGISVSFIRIILLPIVRNAAENAGAVIFAFKNKLDITLGVALGSATQIAMFVVPLSVIFAWILGIKMGLDFNLLETGSLALAILVTAFTLQDGTSHYMKGAVLLLCYVVMGACFFVSTKTIPDQGKNELSLGVNSSSEVLLRA